MKIPANVVVVIAFLVVVYSVSDWVKQYLVTAVSAAPPTCLEMLGNTTTEENGITTIVGRIRNNCNREYALVQVGFKIDRTDTVGLPPAIVSAYGRDLQPGAMWEFRTSPIAKNAAYRLDKITALR
jgi:hypothetical protein